MILGMPCCFPNISIINDLSDHSTKDTFSNSQNNATAIICYFSRLSCVANIAANIIIPSVASIKI